MEHAKAHLVKALVEFFEDDLRRIEHALKVLKYAEHEASGRKDCDREIILAAAILHDVGIKPSEEKLGYNNGKTQEELGPPEAEKILKSIGFPEDKIGKVKEIIGNHHTPSKYDYPELAVLKKADQIVNSRESADQNEF